MRAFLEAWEGPPIESAPLMAMVRGAVTNDDAGAQLRDFIPARLVRNSADCDSADRALRSGLAAAMLVESARA